MAYALQRCSVVDYNVTGVTKIFRIKKRINAAKGPSEPLLVVKEELDK